jgi:hypothetical protein
MVMHLGRAGRIRGCGAAITIRAPAIIGAVAFPKVELHARGALERIGADFDRAGLAVAGEPQ